MGCSVLPSPFFPLLLTECQGLGEGGRNSRKRPAIWCRCGWQSGRSLQQASNSGLPWDLLVVPLRLLWTLCTIGAPPKDNKFSGYPLMATIGSCPNGHYWLLPQWPPSALAQWPPSAPAPMATIGSCPNGHHSLLPQWPPLALAQ